MSWALLLAAGLAAAAALHDRSASQRTAPDERAGDARAATEGARSGERRASKAPGRRVPTSSPFHSKAACDAYLQSRPQSRARGPRIGTWNVRWFPYGAAGRRDAPGTDLDWLACAIVSLDLDVLAVQEFVQDAGGRSALLDLRARLDALTGGRWRDRLDDCPGGGFQHVGFLFDETRVELEAAQPIAALNPGESACDRNLRPGMAAYARFAKGPDLHLVALHLDSGVSERDFTHRARSLAALPQVLEQLARSRPDPDVLLLGDFNTMGCGDCAPKVAAHAELERMDAQLRALELSRAVAPVDQACSQYYRGKAGMLDQIVARSDMKELRAGATIEVHGPCRDLACGRAAPGEDVDAWEHLSDHCPLVIELQTQDLDRG